MKSTVLPTPSHSRLKTARGSGWPSRTTPASLAAHTGLLLQPLLHQHCSPLRGRLSLPMRVRTHGENRAISDPSPALDQGKGSHCQRMSLHTFGREQDQLHHPAPSLCTLGRGSDQLSGVSPMPPALTQTNQGAHTRDKVKPAQNAASSPQVQSQHKPRQSLPSHQEKPSSLLASVPAPWPLPSPQVGW